MRANTQTLRFVNGFLAVTSFLAAGVLLTRVGGTQGIVYSTLAAVTGVWGLLGVLFPRIGVGRFALHLSYLFDWP